MKFVVSCNKVESKWLCTWRELLSTRKRKIEDKNGTPDEVKVFSWRVVSLCVFWCDCKDSKCSLIHKDLKMNLVFRKILNWKTWRFMCWKVVITTESPVTTGCKWVTWTRRSFIVWLIRSGISTKSILMWEQGSVRQVIIWPQRKCRKMYNKWWFKRLFTYKQIALQFWIVATRKEFRDRSNQVVCTDHSVHGSIVTAEGHGHKRVEHCNVRNWKPREKSIGATASRDSLHQVLTYVRRSVMSQMQNSINVVGHQRDHDGDPMRKPVCVDANPNPCHTMHSWETGGWDNQIFSSMMTLKWLHYAAHECAQESGLKTVLHEARIHKNLASIVDRRGIE